MKKILPFLLITLVLGYISCKENLTDEPEKKDTSNGWTIETIDSIADANVGFFNMLAIDSDTGIHVAYTAEISGQDVLKYAYKAYNGNWTNEIVFSGLEREIIDIAIDSQDRIYIAFEKEDDGQLYLTEKQLIDDNFNQIVLSESHLACYPALRIGPNDTLHISYQEKNKGMRYTNHIFGQSDHIIQTIGNDDDILGSRSAVCADAQNNVNVLWHDNDQVKYAYLESGTNQWQVSDIANGEYGASYEDVGMILDKNNNLHAYYLNGQTNNNIVYLNKLADQTTWTSSNLNNNQGKRIDRGIATDTLNIPYIVFGEQEDSKSLQIAHKKTSWNFERIVTTENYISGKNTDIKITDLNVAYISFYVETSNVLKYAVKRLE